MEFAQITYSIRVCVIKRDIPKKDRVLCVCVLCTFHQVLRTPLPLRIQHALAVKVAHWT